MLFALLRGETPAKPARDEFGVPDMMFKVSLGRVHACCGCECVSLCSHAPVPERPTARAFPRTTMPNATLIEAQLF